MPGFRTLHSLSLKFPRPPADADKVQVDGLPEQPWEDTSMRRLLQCAGLVLLFGWNALPAPAQERATPAGTVTPVVHDLRQPLVPTGPYAANGPGCAGPGCAGQNFGGQPAAADGRWRPLKNCLNKQGSCCFVDQNSPGCSSCYANASPNATAAASVRSPGGS